MKFTLTFDQAAIKPAKKATLEKLAKNLTLKGFRPGKAPLDLVEQHIGPEKLVEETSSALMPEAYNQYIKDHDLKPITQPKITLQKMVNDGDWTFEVEIAEKPAVKLNKYQDAIKTIKVKDVIWTPDKKDTPEPKTPQEKQEADSKKMNAIMESLLQTAELEIPELLVEEEVNHSLSHLLEQVEKLGLKLDQYLSSVGKTPEALREDYRKSAIDNLKLEFIIDAIAKDQKFNASDAELDEVLSKTDEATAKAIKSSPMETASVKYALIKQKVVDYLLNL